MVDLQKSEDFQTLGVELVSIAPDTVESWRDDGEEYGIQDYSAVLSDVENEVANQYDVMKWAAATGEPGHTFIVIDNSGNVSWIRDYGALENGGIMYVVPDELVGSCGLTSSARVNRREAPRQEGSGFTSITCHNKRNDG